jgi:hypothetical protein
VKEMSSREILDAIRRGVEESARRAAEHRPEHALRLPPQATPERSIGEMTAQEIRDAIDKGLEEISRRLLNDHGEHSISPSKDGAARVSS